MFNFNVNFQDMFAKIQERRSKMLSSDRFKSYSASQTDLSSAIKTSVKDCLADVKKSTSRQFKTIFTETPDVSPKVEDETPVFDEVYANYGIVCKPEDKTPTEKTPVDTVWEPTTLMNYGIVCPSDFVVEDIPVEETPVEEQTPVEDKTPEDETPIFDQAMANYGIVCPFDDIDVGTKKDTGKKIEVATLMNYGIVCSFDTNID